MNRCVWVCMVIAPACGTTDDRPATLPYIARTILAPTCATAECHSAFKQEVGDVFDTASSARHSIVANGLVAYPDDVADPSQAYLITTLTVGSPSIKSPGSGNVRMPYDAPMPDADIRLIEAWIADGLPGAQCEPNPQKLGCLATTVAGHTVYQVVECPDGNVGAVVTLCPQGQVCQVFTGNGQCVTP